ncbi:hypothetical protein V9N52_003696 [Vibrio navarrensis]
MKDNSKKVIRNIIATVSTFVVLSPCSYGKSDWHNEKHLGGTFSVYSYGESPYNRSAPFLTLNERQAFSSGATEFKRIHQLLSDFAQPGSVYITESHNAWSCESCHVKDGRGLSHSRFFSLTGFSVVNKFSHSITPVFRQPVDGDVPIAKLFDVKWKTKTNVTLSEGETVELIAPVAMIEGVKQTVDLRNAPGVYGLGLLEAVSDQEIKDFANRKMFYEFGVKGFISSVSEKGLIGGDDKVGIFGWKGSFASLENQVRQALKNELGIITHPEFAHSDSHYATLVQGLTDYLAVLAVPARRSGNFKKIEQGAELFEETGCTMCHKPSWRTIADDSVKEKFRNLTIFPFTDFLLHDMGEGLKDNNNDELSRFWKTPPLWGIGMQSTISDKAGFLHDGRARSLVEAILWHGGEAEYSVNKFKSLPRSDRGALLEFLSSL